MNNGSFENLCINLSNSWIISCSILTCGILTCSYLKSLNNLSLFHMKQKYKLLDFGEEKDNIKLYLLNEKIKKEEKLFIYYEKTFYFGFIIGISISGISIFFLKISK